MNQTEVLVALIKAFKKNDQKTADSIILFMIETAEKRNQYKLAKKLREVYSYSSKESATSNFQTASLTSSTSERSGLFEIRHSKLNSTQIVLSSTNDKVLKEIVENYKKRDLLKKHGITNGSNVILHGPPGTGKTLFAYILAGELNVPVYHVYLDVLVSSFLGETGKNLKSIFEEASKEECVLLLDEFDAIAKHRDDSQELGELKRVVTVLLQNIDALSPQTILIAATNHEHLLDPAVWRRFDYSIKMDVLDTEARKSLLQLYLSGHRNIDIPLLAELSEGLSGAVMKQAVNRSLKRSILSDQDNLQEQLIESFLTTNMVRDERLKGSKRDNFIRAIKYLRNHDEKKYTFEELERITGMPTSTLHYLSNQ